MMEHARSKREFSHADRVRLRAALIDYMKEHDIGVPSLQLRIAKATDRSPDLVPLKTLQRFLADTTRTNDGLLSLCFQFAESVAPKAGAAGFSDAAASFFGLPRSNGNADELIGRWRGFAAGNRQGIVAVKAATGEDRTSFSTSDLIVEVMENGQGLRIREQVTNPAASRTAKYDPGFRHSYEGIALQFSPLLCIVAKNLLTHLPRTYWLQLFDDGYLAGHGAEAIFGGGPTRVVSDMSAFKFERSEEEPGHG